MDFLSWVLWLGLLALFLTYRKWLIGAVSRTVTLVRGFNIQKTEESAQGVQQTSDTLDQYVDLHQKTDKDRAKNYEWFVNAYYNVSTIFYEWAWGSSFHFAPRKEFETFKGAILRHEMRLADRLRLKEGQQVLDIGCGIGGPLFNIHKATGAVLTGLNNNAYQVTRANTMAKEQGIDKNCRFVKGDFCKMEFAKDETYDACYAIESTCHAPRREDVFSQVFRVLKPGGYFGGYEWVTTAKHDPSNPEHVRAAKNILHGNGLPHLSHYEVVPDALRAVGFEVVEYEDFFLNRSGENMPWYEDLEGSYLRPTTFQFTPIGRWLLFHLLTFLERAEIAPKGVKRVSEMLHVGADGLVAGGKMGTFTPGFWFLARKPVR